MKKIASIWALLFLATITHTIESSQRQTRKPSRPQGIIKPKHNKTGSQRPRIAIINSLNIAHYFLGDACNEARENIPNENQQKEHTDLLNFLNDMKQQIGNAVVDLETGKSLDPIKVRKPDRALHAIIFPTEGNEVADTVIDIEN